MIEGVRALVFDTYGTLVDWRSSVLDELAVLGARVDRERFLTEWKACYREGMDKVDRGEWPWTTVDAIYRRRLVELLDAHGVTLSRDEIDELLGLAPAQVMMVAAHNYDLRAARAEGMPTAFIPRPTEYGPGQTSDLAPEEAWDVVAKDVEDLAATLGA